MDFDTTLEMLKHKALVFRDERDWGKFHNPKDLSVDLIIEAAELLEHFRFKTDAQMAETLANPKAREAVADEMGDILLALVLLSDNCKIDLSDAFLRKLEKTAKRYPVEKVKGKNKKYDEY
jgi:NTP pyrophosphatase (non-canonical NTP hydrolase)